MWGVRKQVKYAAALIAELVLTFVAVSADSTGFEGACHDILQLRGYATYEYCNSPYVKRETRETQLGVATFDGQHGVP